MPIQVVAVITNDGAGDMGLTLIGWTRNQFLAQQVAAQQELDYGQTVDIIPVEEILA